MEVNANTRRQAVVATFCRSLVGGLFKQVLTRSRPKTIQKAHDGAFCIDYDLLNFATTCLKTVLFFVNISTVFPTSSRDKIKNATFVSSRSFGKNMYRPIEAKFSEIF